MRVCVQIAVIGAALLAGYLLGASVQSAEDQRFTASRFDPTTAIPVPVKSTPPPTFDPSRLVPEEVNPPAPGVAPYRVGAIYEKAGLQWQYLGGTDCMRFAWRVKNQKGEYVMPVVFAGLNPLWMDALSVEWTYTGAMDSTGNPLVKVIDQFPIDRKPEQLSVNK